MITEPEQSIVQKHLSNDFHLLQKDSSKRIGYGGGDLLTLNAGYDLTGLNNKESHPYLPHFEYNVGTFYTITIPKKSFVQCHIRMHEYDTTDVQLRAKDNSSSLIITLPELNHLFDLSKLARECNPQQQLESLLKIKEQNLSRLPLTPDQLYMGFYLRASSTSYGQFTANMDINQPNADKIIAQFLTTIDQKFQDYQQLQPLFQEKDKKGNILWEDQNMQSKAYNTLRQQLHKSLFDDLINIIQSNNLKPKIELNPEPTLLERIASLF